MSLTLERTHEIARRVFDARTVLELSKWSVVIWAIEDGRVPDYVTREQAAKVREALRERLVEKRVVSR